MTALLAIQSVEAQPPTIGTRQNIASLPANAHVAVSLNDGTTVRGRIVSRADQDFVLKTDNGGAPETIAYSQVSAVEPIKAHRSTKKTLIIVGVVAVATLGIIAGVVATHLKY